MLMQSRRPQKPRPPGASSFPEPNTVSIAKSYGWLRHGELDNVATLIMRSILIWSAAMNKTLSFAVLHFSVAFLLGWLFTGSLLVGGALALVEPACNTVVFHFHEKVWKRIEQRRSQRTTESCTKDLNALPST